MDALPLSSGSLIARLRTASGDETLLHRQAWTLRGVAIPPDASDLLDRGAFLESVLALARTGALRAELMSWEITYTSAGPPYGSAMEIRSADGTVRTVSETSEGSATRALLAVLLRAAA